MSALGNEPVTPPPAEETPVEPPPAATGPWAADLDEYFGDNAEAKAAADRYLREKIQPRITQLEQGPANLLYRDLTDEKKVDVTVAAVVQQVYGEDVARKFIDLFGEDGEGADDPAAAAAAVAADEEEQETPPAPEQEWARSKMEEEAREKEEREYDEFLDSVVAEPEFKLTPDDKELLHPFMAGSETVGEAVEKYHGYVHKMAERAGITYEQARAGLQQQAADDAATEGQSGAPQPPPTIGDAGGTAPQPVAKKYTSWDDLGEALSDYQKEQVAKKAGNAPPTL